MSATPLILFDSPGSPCARRVKISLIEKGIPFELVTLDLSSMEQKRADYLELNPNGVVPTLVHGGRVVFEANVITRYLDDAFPDTPLYPTDIEGLCTVTSWQNLELEIAKKFRPLLYQRLMGPMVRMTKTLDQALDTVRKNDASLSDIAWETRVWSVDVATPQEEAELEAKHRELLGVLETQLSKTPFLMGSSLGIADISVAPRVAMYPMIQIDLEKDFPKVADWVKRLEARKSFSSTVSDEEAKLRKMAGTPLLVAASRVYGKDRKSSFSDKLITTLAKPILKKVVAKAAKARTPLVIPDVKEMPVPEFGIVPPFTTDISKLIPITICVQENDPTGNAVEILANAIDGVTVQEADRFEFQTGDTRLTSPYLALEILARVSKSTVWRFPHSVDEATKVRCWLALAAGSEKDFRPFLTATGRKTGAGFIVDQSMSELEVKRRLEIVTDGLGNGEFLVGDGATVADLCWAVEIDALHQTGLIDVPNKLRSWSERLVSA